MPIAVDTIMEGFDCWPRIGRERLGFSPFGALVPNSDETSCHLAQTKSRSLFVGKIEKKKSVEAKTREQGLFKTGARLASFLHSQPMMRVHIGANALIDGTTSILPPYKWPV